MRWAVLSLLAAAAVPVSIVLALYARWWWAGGRGADGEPLPLAWWGPALAHEAVALTIAAARTLSRQPSAGASPLAAPPDIVLLAGGGVAEAALAPLLDRLAATGWTAAVFRPTSWRIPVADAAAQLDGFLRAQARPGGVTLVAYGTAGMVLRYFLRRYPATGVRRVVTIATAHQGTEAPPFCFGEPRPPEADLLRQLAAGDRVPQQFDVIAIASDFDAFIAPATRAYYPGAFNIQVRGVGHFALAGSPRLFELLAENLGPPPSRLGAAHHAR